MININMGDLWGALGRFISSHWQTIALVVMVGLFFATKNDYKTLQKSMQLTNESYEQQISALEALHLEEIRRRDEARLEYEKEILELTELYDQALDDLRRDSAEDIAEFIRDFTLQPQKLAKEIEEEFGFEYVE